MTTIIIYAITNDFLDKTIDSILDNTNKKLIDAIIVCNDNNFDYHRSDIKIIKTNKIGRAKVWNLASNDVQSKYLIFLQNGTKVSNNWLAPIIDKLYNHPNSLISPSLYDLNGEFWASKGQKSDCFGWRWDLETYSRKSFKNYQSPCLSDHCIAVGNQWFNDLGKFDDGMTCGPGESLELSLRSWLFGGSIYVIPDSEIAIINHNESINFNNLMRIIEIWFPMYAYRFLESRNLKKDDLNPGKLINLILLQSKQINSSKWYCQNLQPEIDRLYNLKNSAVGASIAILGTGPSLDYIAKSQIDRHEIVIGVDFTGYYYKCNYIVSDMVHIISQLLDIYDEEDFVVPNMLGNMAAGKYDHSFDIVPRAICYENGQLNVLQSQINPPFCNFENSMISALHLALFMKPREIILYGYDNKLINGKSHTSKIDQYDNGEIWDDSESTRKRFSFYEYGLNHLSKLATKFNIPVIRVAHL